MRASILQLTSPTQNLNSKSQLIPKDIGRSTGSSFWQGKERCESYIFLRYPIIKILNPILGFGSSQSFYY